MTLLYIVVTCDDGTLVLRHDALWLTVAVLEGSWAERTEVHKAASQGLVDQLRQLIADGAPVNIVAVDSITPLHEACIRGQSQCVRLLLDAGAQVGPSSSCVTQITLLQCG